MKNLQVYFCKNLKKYHDLEAIVNKINLEYSNLLTVSTRQIFNWIKSNRLILKKSDRLRNYYLKGSKRKNGFYSKFKDKFLLPIWVRHKNIDLRLDYGHWEADLIVGKRSSGFSNILTLVERKTRMSYATIVKSKNPIKINSALLKLIKQNKLEVKTITWDRIWKNWNLSLLNKVQNIFLWTLCLLPKRLKWKHKWSYQENF